VVRLIKRINWWAVVGLVIVALMIFYQSYNGRVDLWRSQYKGCLRAQKYVYSPSADGWRTAEVARQETGGKISESAANEYERIANGFEFLAKLDCRELYPKPSPTG
jgi:hypothetical protein